MPYFKDQFDRLHFLDSSDDEWRLPTGCIPITDSAAASIEAAAMPTASQLLRAAAQTALDATDLVCLRCYKAGVTYPSAWQTYTLALRAIVNGSDTTSTTLPARPAYPSGT